MTKLRTIKRTFEGHTVREGAGVYLKRIFSHDTVKLLDPFLLLDNFGSDNPKDYLAGFPWHPHRGIETITYMIQGEVEHKDSLGNKGVIKTGDVQWMTAGSGIIHQEMPKKFDGTMKGFQLWTNLPAKNKMMNPRYRDVLSDQIPQVDYDKNVKIKIIAGKINDVEGPVTDIVTKPEYFDITVQPNSLFKFEVKSTHTYFAFIFEGEGYFDSNKNSLIAEGTGVLFDDGDSINVQTKDKHVRFLLISGKPIKEPIVWQGPIVMNTQEEIQIAFAEYRNGTFIKKK